MKRAAPPVYRREQQTDRAGPGTQRFRSRYSSSIRRGGVEVPRAVPGQCRSARMVQASQHDRQRITPECSGSGSAPPPQRGHWITGKLLRREVELSQLGTREEVGPLNRCERDGPTGHGVPNGHRARHVRGHPGVQVRRGGGLGYAQGKAMTGVESTRALRNSASVQGRTWSGGTLHSMPPPGGRRNRDPSYSATISPTASVPLSTANRPLPMWPRRPLVRCTAIIPPSSDVPQGRNVLVSAR